MTVITRKVEMSSTCSFEFTHYEGFKPDVDITYIEHSSDSYYSDSETTIDIDKEKAIEIIKFMKESFGIED